ncbi:MAG: FAD-dependent thymidylate synthase [Candidatus Micrarchaeia archaeon]
MEFITGASVVKRIAYTDKPFDLAVASARSSCNPKLVYADEVTEEQRDRIGKSIYEAGHHTPFQHATFVFGFENISHHFTWSFLHSHVGAIPSALSADTLNNWTLSPLMRVLFHSNYVFRKKISHTADSQNQRHRTTPASRPLLSRTHSREQDYVTPQSIADNADALEVYENAMTVLWNAKNELVDAGVPAEHACYLLPNAVSVCFTESAPSFALFTRRACALASTRNAKDSTSRCRNSHKSLQCTRGWRSILGQRAKPAMASSNTRLLKARALNACAGAASACGRTFRTLSGRFER